MEVGLGPGDVVLDGDTAPHPRKGAQHPHISADFVLAWSPISAAAEHLLLLATIAVLSVKNATFFLL